MGEMAELAAEEYYADLARIKKHRFNPFKTENVLNSSTWTDGQGTIHNLKEMEKDHLQNVLFFIYKRRDRYWLNCQDVRMIEKFKDGDQFFHLVIRKSTIWKSIIAELEMPVEGFNFGFIVPGDE